MLTLREAAAVIREVREDRRWSQIELASRAGVSRTFVIDLEAGKPTIEAARFLDVAQALGLEFGLRPIDGGEERW